MITADAPREEAVVLTTTLELERPRMSLAFARLEVTAHGIYEVSIGGRRVGEAVLAPGWTSYHHRLQVAEHDVMPLVADGVSVEVLLGNGWWRGALGFEGLRIDYGEDLGLLLALHLTFADGHEQVVTSGPDWSARRSEITAHSLYDGQRIDARRRGHVESLDVREVSFDRSTLVRQDKPDILRHEMLRPVRRWESPSGRLLLDFGQNLAGWVRVRATGPPGTEITLRHAEVLEDGEIATRPLRLARATDTYVLSGGADVFEPTMTFHGFRYVEVTGWPGPMGEDALEAVVVHSRMRKTSTFACSSELVTQLAENAEWGQRGTFLDLPMDCPQRDERLGWTGDIAVFAETACRQFDVADLLHGWLRDLAADTAGSGYVPLVVPDLLALSDAKALETIHAAAGPKAVWSDAAAWVPSALWWAYGDRDRLAEHYPVMTAHLMSVEPLLAPDGTWVDSPQLGDWLDPLAPADRPLASRADPGVVATACFYRSACITAEAAEALGHAEDASRWRALADRTRRGFCERFLEPSGRLTSDAPTVYALAIHLDLLDEDSRRLAGDRLAELVVADGYCVATGFVGTPFVPWALTATGHLDVAYRLMLQERCPSWLYPVTMGATTVWERWDAMLPDGSINPGEMTSFNHVALGAVVDWLYGAVAGIQALQPGYGRVLLAPKPGPGLEWARATVRTGRGEIACGWRRADEGVEVQIEVPGGVEAEVLLPDGRRFRAAPGSHSFASALPPRSAGV